MVDVEREVAPALHEEGGHLDVAEEGARRALVRERAHSGEVSAGERVVDDRLELGCGAGRDRLPEAEHDARAGEVLRQKRGVEVGPRDRRLDRGERDAFGRRAPDRAAPVGVAEGADALPVDPGLGSEPVEELAHVLDLARAVDRDKSFGLAVAPRVEGEHGVALRGELGLGERVERPPERCPCVPAPAEPVQEHHCGPSACGWCAVGDVVRRGEPDAVAHLNRLVGLAERGRGRR